MGAELIAGVQVGIAGFELIAGVQEPLQNLILILWTSCLQPSPRLAKGCSNLV